MNVSPDNPDVIVSVCLRPFAKGTVLAYELVLKRSSGDRVYDRSLGFLSPIDARDLRAALNDIELVEAF